MDTMGEHRENSPEELAKNVLDEYFRELARIESVIGQKQTEDVAVAVDLLSEIVHAESFEIESIADAIGFVEEQMNAVRVFVPNEPEDSPVESSTLFGPFVKELSDDSEYELKPIIPDDEGFIEVTTERLAEYENRMKLNKKSLPIIKGLIHFVVERKHIITMDQLRHWIDTELDDNSFLGWGYSVEDRNVSIAVKLLEKITGDTEEKGEGDVIARLIKPENSSNPHNDIELLAFLPAE